MKKLLKITTLLCVASSIVLFAYIISIVTHQVDTDILYFEKTVAIASLSILAISAIIRRIIEVKYIRRKDYKMMNCINAWSGIICLPLIPSIITFLMPTMLFATMRESKEMHGFGYDGNLKEVVSYFYIEMSQFNEMKWFFWFCIIGTVTIFTFGVYLYGLITKQAIQNRANLMC